MKKNTILIKLSLIFFLFMAIIIAINAFNTYSIQRESYKENIEQSLKHISAFLKNLIIIEGKKFLYMQDFMISNIPEFKIPRNFNGDYTQEKLQFDTQFATTYPGKIFEKDVAFEELSYEMKFLFTEYMFKKWLNIFEKAKETFEIKYAYYLVPSDEYLHMYWLIDFHRGVSKYHGPDYINICADVFEPVAEHEKMWEAWNTGQTPKGYDIYDNKYGRTYGYYIPLFVDGQKCGVIGIEIETDKVQSGIFYASLHQILYMSIVTIFCICAMLYIIYKTLLVRIECLQKYVNLYTTHKNVNIAKEIDAHISGNDEIGSFAQCISSMIFEIDKYTNSIKNTLLAFYAERKRANEMHRLAERDSLTGIKNKTAYDFALQDLEQSIADGNACFAIAVIDLNYLKKINDTYGHERGDCVIIALCKMICAIFDHFPVYRIGGDEFAVIGNNATPDSIDPLVTQFIATMRKAASDTALEPWERVSAAIGVAFYDPEKDPDADSVFKRADMAMYAMKKHMKSANTL